MTRPARVGIRCDAGLGTGVGHLVRCVALAEELRRRHSEVHFLSDLGGLAWAERQLATREFPRHPAPATAGDLVDAVRGLSLDALITDSYHLPSEHGQAVRAAGRPVVALVDGELRGQRADLYVDQNLDAETIPVRLPVGAVRLAGLRYALLRDAVRRLRPLQPRRHEAGPARVVAFFGGTDAYRAAPVLTRLIIATGVAVSAVVVAADDEMHAALSRLRPAPGQEVTAIAPTDDLPALLAEADLAVSASGTSTWELLCLGLPTALVWVVDNQLLGYRRTVARDLAAGLGKLGDLTDDPVQARHATEVLRGLLTDPAARTRLAHRAWAAVDGKGAERVVDEMLRRIRAAEPAEHA